MDATQEEIDAAATTVDAALSHPLMRRAVQPPPVAYVGRSRLCFVVMTERSPKASLTSHFSKKTGFCRLDRGGLQDRSRIRIDRAKYLAQVASMWKRSRRRRTCRKGNSACCVIHWQTRMMTVHDKHGVIRLDVAETKAFRSARVARFAEF